MRGIPVLLKYLCPSSLPGIIVLAIAIAGCTGTHSTAGITTLPAPTTVPVSVESTTLVQPTPTPTPDPCPRALSLRQVFPFGSGKVAGEATVYGSWINDTYQWLNAMDNHYYTKNAGTGSKYLFVFVQLTNTGNTRVWFPPSSTIVVHYNGMTYVPDPSHYLPDKGEREKETPVEISEVQVLPETGWRRICGRLRVFARHPAGFPVPG